MIRWKSEQNHMQIRDKNHVPYLSWEELEQFSFIRHGFSTRMGGTSEGIFSSMNLSFSRGDDENAVHENYVRIADAIGFSKENIVCSDQTHTTNVRLVTKDDRGSGITRERDFHDVDGMITNEADVVLATFYADCVPLFFVDPIHKAIGLSHSGWKGTVGHMAYATLQAMKENFGSDPKEMTVAIGPSICQDCYEVSEDVIEQFRAGFPEEIHDQLFYRKENGKYQLDLQEANRFLFLQAGVEEKNISMPGICTCCNPDFLFSHRASKGKRGNLAAFLCITE